MLVGGAAVRPVDKQSQATFVVNLRGSSAFPDLRESVHGTVVTTNLDTGGTYTNVFTASSRDHVITDNGDGARAVPGQAQQCGCCSAPVRSGAPVQNTVAQSFLTLMTVQPSRVAWSSACSAPVV
jgi:hypothetical protein